LKPKSAIQSGQINIQARSLGGRGCLSNIRAGTKQGPECAMTPAQQRRGWRRRGEEEEDGGKARGFLLIGLNYCFTCLDSPSRRGLMPRDGRFSCGTTAPLPRGGGGLLPPEEDPRVCRRSAGFALPPGCPQTQPQGSGGRRAGKARGSAARKTPPGPKPTKPLESNCRG